MSPRRGRTIACLGLGAALVAAIALVERHGPLAGGVASGAPAAASASDGAPGERAAIPPAGESADRSAAPAAGSGGSAAQADDERGPGLDGPSDGELAAETAEDPHVTPAALIDFSHQVAALMVSARRDEKAARSAFSRLADCAIDERGTQVPQARVLCVANAHQLAVQFPASLGSRYQALASQAPEIVQLARMTGIDD